MGSAEHLVGDVQGLGVKAIGRRNLQAGLGIREYRDYGCCFEFSY